MALCVMFWTCVFYFKKKVYRHIATDKEVTINLYVLNNDINCKRYDVNSHSTKNNHAIGEKILSYKIHCGLFAVDLFSSLKIN